LEICDDRVLKVLHSFRTKPLEYESPQFYPGSMLQATPSKQYNHHEPHQHLIIYRFISNEIHIFLEN
jgi:hypothetical protein